MVEAKIDTDKKILLVLILVLLIGSILGTYSYFTSKSTSENKTISTATLDIEFMDNNPYINAENIIPITDDKILTNAAKKEFTIKNTGNISLNAKIQLSDIVITEALKNENFKWALYENNSKLNEGNFSGLSSTSLTLLENIAIESTNERTYTLYIWIHETNEAQDELQNGTLSSSITITGVQQ